MSMAVGFTASNAGISNRLILSQAAGNIDGSKGLGIDAQAQAIRSPDNVAGPQISAGASAASGLLDQANQFVQSTSLTSAVQWKAGYASASAYVNVKEFNDFVFDYAAQQMVEGGAKQGLSLDKDTIVDTLRRSNPQISSTVDDNKARMDSLKFDNGIATYTYLDDNDREGFTAALISEVKNGGDGSEVHKAAGELALTKALDATDGPYQGPPGGPSDTTDAEPAAGISTSSYQSRPYVMTKADVGNALLASMMDADASTSSAVVNSLPSSHDVNSAANGA